MPSTARSEPGESPGPSALVCDRHMASELPGPTPREPLEAERECGVPPLSYAATRHTLSVMGPSTRQCQSPSQSFSPEQSPLEKRTERLR